MRKNRIAFVAFLALATLMVFGAGYGYGAPAKKIRIAMLMADAPNIREVIAFPKTQAAVDLMTQAPSEVDERQLKDLHIDIGEVLTGLRRGRGEWEADVPEAVAQRIIEGRLLGYDTE